MSVPSLTSSSCHQCAYVCPTQFHSDVWETMFIKQLSGSQTFHVFDAPPTKVCVSYPCLFYPKRVLTTAVVDLTSVVVSIPSQPTFLATTIPCRFSLLDPGMCKAMARELSPTLTEASAQSNLAVASPELRVRRRVHPPLRANHPPHPLHRPRFSAPPP